MKFGVTDENIDAIDFSLPEVDLQFLDIGEKIPYHKVEFRFGAPVWADKNYVGTLYPEKTPQRLFLHTYAQKLNSIEVNATRFGTPKISTIQKWKDSVPDDFKFSLKIPQVITHRKDMNDDTAKYRLDEFFVALDTLGKNNGISFVVMPNYLKYEHLNKLEKFVIRLPKDVMFAIEFRDASWFAPSAIADWYPLLKENNIITINTATYERRDVLQLKLTNKHLFVRYVGKYFHPSDKVRMDNWVAKIKELIDLGAVHHIWFYVHQPGENRQWIVDFFNDFIGKLNASMQLNLKLID